MYSSILFSVCVVVMLPSLTTAECCKAVCEDIPLVDALCADCTKASPYCATGSCNMFGCNCDGGCRKGPCGMCCGNGNVGETRKQGVEAVMEYADIDRDGRLNLNESIHYYLTNVAKLTTPEGPIITEFAKLDKNKDGFLSPSEIDN
ncbi:uncharacterized protein Diedel [Planococcus citri]|uniref:uncharacterized protein Diedel n=1 Tax=Planococcus citri TaxID=170843 RepID=UPI0031F79F08